MLKPRWEVEPQGEPEAFRAALREWFASEGRDYPWRRTSDPYAVLVSEMMLQQTRVATVLGRGFYTRFMEQFPDTGSLAAAGDDELLKAWEGLGYYRRARMLREAARTVEREYGGIFPREEAALAGLPGVGRYTLGAVRSFAYGEAAALVDGNVARVLARLMDSEERIDSTAGSRRLWAWAEELLDREEPRIYNSALMELGQRLCVSGVPQCLSCPVARFCRTRRPEELPRKGKKAAVTEVSEHVVLARSGGKVLLRKVNEGRRAGMWRLPERPAEKCGEVLHSRKYGITRYRVTLHVHGVERVRARKDEAWWGPEEVEELAMPPADRAALRAAGEIA